MNNLIDQYMRTNMIRISAVPKSFTPRPHNHYIISFTLPPQKSHYILIAHHSSRAHENLLKTKRARAHTEISWDSPASDS